MSQSVGIGMVSIQLIACLDDCMVMGKNVNPEGLKGVSFHFSSCRVMHCSGSLCFNIKCTEKIELKHFYYNILLEIILN